MNNLYYLSIGSIFKNESLIIEEWISHYLNRGVEHFYLINDNSDDDSVDKLKPYIDSGLVTLFNNEIPKHRGRQSEAYNKYLLPIIKETKWMAIFDIDEFCYSPNEINLCNVLRKYENLSQIEVNWVWFGSNGYDNHPGDIVKNFITRAPIGFKQPDNTPFGYDICTTDGDKSILNTDYKIYSIGIHGTIMDGEKKNLSWKSDPKNPEFLINHYSILSKEYWEKVKMKRGDADNWHSDTARNWNYFKKWDINQELDFRLHEQNLLITNK